MAYAQFAPWRPARSNSEGLGPALIGGDEWGRRAVEGGCHSLYLSCVWDLPSVVGLWDMVAKL